jgi:hypothetical protein
MTVLDLLQGGKKDLPFVHRAVKITISGLVGLAASELAERAYDFCYKKWSKK